jgi:hypothetical protein
VITHRFHICGRHAPRNRGIQQPPKSQFESQRLRLLDRPLEFTPDLIGAGDDGR